MKNFSRLLYVNILLCTVVAFPVKAEDSGAPPTNSSVTFLYYTDLAAAEDFYGNILGFKKDFDGEWVKIFRITDGGRVGLVDNENGYLKATNDKPVMLSIDTSDVDYWYERIKARAAKYIKSHPKEESDGFVKGFIMTDTEGYHVEFFQWKEEHRKY